MAGNALPILLIGGAAALMLVGKKKKKADGLPIAPSLPSIDPSKFGPTKSYSPTKGSSSGYPNVSRTQMVEIQNKLIALGFSVGPKGADGLYGPATKEAVLAFQMKYMPKSAGWDGKPGPKTRSALDAAFAALPAGQQSAANQQTSEDQAEVKKESAPIINITTDSYFHKFVTDSSSGRILIITTSGQPRPGGPLFEDKTIDDNAKHNGAVYDELLKAAAIGNAGKMLFARVDLSTFVGNLPFQYEANTIGYPNYFPMMVGLAPGVVNSFGTKVIDGRKLVKNLLPLTQSLINKIASTGAGTA